MDKSAKKFVNDDLDWHDYKRIKESLSRECTELRRQIAELKAAFRNTIGMVYPY